jgi:hypothetical protein
LPLLPSQRWCHCGTGIIAEVALAPLGHHCRRGAGVIADITLAPLPLLPSRYWYHCSVGVIATITLALLGHRCHHGAGVLADVAVAPLPLLPSQRWHHCGAGIIADVALAPLGHSCRRGAGVFADVALVPLPLLLLRRWHHCSALASSRPLPWHRLGIVAFAVLSSLRTLPCAVVIIAVTALASSRRWHHRGRRPGAAWASLLSRRWHHCGRCPGVVAIVAVVALASLQRWHHTTQPLTRTLLANAVTRVATAAVKQGFDTAFNAASPTYASLSSIVRGAGVGAPFTAKSLALAEGASTKSLAAFLGVVWLTLRGLDVIDDIPSSENLSLSSKGITSGPFAPAAAFAVVRQGGFVQRLAPSRFKETQGNLPPAVFWHFSAAGPPSAAGLPSAIAPAVLPMPILRMGPTFGAIVGAILFYLIWLVHGGFWALLVHGGFWGFGWCTEASGQHNEIPSEYFCGSPQK